MSNSEEIRVTATQWFIDIHEVEDPSAELLHNWMRWMEASESHRVAFNSIEQLWRDAAALTPQQIQATVDSSLDDCDGSMSVVAWQERRHQRLRLKSGRGGRKRWPAVAAAAALAAIALIATTRNHIFFGHPDASDSFATRSAEQMQVPLPDGSQVSLGARSKLTVTYTQAERNVRLESGEAFFV